MSPLPPMLEVRQATLEDAPTLDALIRLCGLDMATKGHTNWLPPYPFGLVRQNAEAGELYLGLLGGRPVGTFALERDPGKAYPAGLWQEPQAPARYLHRLAVHPDQQGRGLGRRLLEAAETIALELGCEWLRLDAKADNPELLAFYQRAGYVPRGTLTLILAHPVPSELHLTCLERPLPVRQT